MKLLSWMRTKKQNGLDPSKEFKGDFCCLRAQVPSEVQDIRTNSFSFHGLSHEPKPPGIEEGLRLDEDGFCGFLTIGTLGTNPETPKFAASAAEGVAGEKKEMAKLITEKLEKFLEEHPKDTDVRTVQRLDGKGDGESNVCPLEGFDLFRPSMELSKRSNGGVKKKKGLLTSLFKRGETVQGESYMEKHGTRDLIKRIFKKLHGSSSKKTIDVDDDDDDDDYSMHKKKDHRKNVQIFRSKVHPVLSSPATDDKKIDARRTYINSCDLKLPSLTGGFVGSSSISKANRKRENWIKTDTEFLVLEL